MGWPYRLGDLDLNFDTPHSFQIQNSKFNIQNHPPAARAAYMEKEKPPELYQLRGLPKVAATYSPASAVPSARRGLTSLFGMGRGGTLAPWPP